jgi:hypothetical protein
MSAIEDFSAQDLNIAREILKERYGQDVEIQLSDVELRLYPGAQELTTRPASYWEMRDYHLMVSNLGKMRYYV